MECDITADQLLMVEVCAAPAEKRHPLNEIELSHLLKFCQELHESWIVSPMSFATSGTQLVELLAEMLGRPGSPILTLPEQHSRVIHPTASNGGASKLS